MASTCIMTIPSTKECGVTIKKREEVQYFDISGEYTFNNGDKYDGEFKNGKRDGGPGRYIQKSGEFEIVDAMYDNDQIYSGKIYDKKSNQIVCKFNGKI